MFLDEVGGNAAPYFKGNSNILLFAILLMCYKNIKPHFDKILRNGQQKKSPLASHTFFQFERFPILFRPCIVNDG